MYLVGNKDTTAKHIFWSRMTSLKIVAEISWYTESFGQLNMRPRQNGRCFADNIFKCIFLNKNIWISIKISLNFVPKGQIKNITALVQIMVWHRPGDKPLSEPIMVKLLMQICIIWPQWVNLSKMTDIRDWQLRVNIIVIIFLIYLVFQKWFLLFMVLYIQQLYTMKNKWSSMRNIIPCIFNGYMVPENSKWLYLSCIFIVYI